MKTKLFLTLILVALLATVSRAQNYEYWGITSDSYRIYKTDANGENLQWMYTLNTGIDGQDPHTALMRANNKKLYGTCSHGGSGISLGTFFEYNTIDSSLSVLVDFEGKNGALPEGNVIQASNGKLYGMTTAGGSSYDTIPPGTYYRSDGWGTLFEYDPVTQEHKILWDFMQQDGIYPYGNLLQIGDYLYGTTSSGVNSYNTAGGTIFKFGITDSSFTVLYHFVPYSTGHQPYSSLLLANNGKLYGTARSGGNSGSGYGVLYEFDIETNNYQGLFTFAESGGIYPSGLYPEADLVQANDGKLYGVCGNGGEPRYTNDDGVLFSYDITNQTFERIFCFPESGSPGKWPNTALIQASNGKLYGANHQSVYEYDPVAGTVTGKAGGVSNYCGLVEVEITVEDTFTVIFQDYDSSILITEKVVAGNSAVAPADPKRAGYSFTGWDTDFSNITSDLTVTAQYTIILDTFVVSFQDYDGTILKTDSVANGGAATAPESPLRIGYTFSGWDTEYDNVITDLTITAKYDINYYTVSYIDFDGTIILQQMVPYNQSATPPAQPTRNGYIFIGWNSSFDHITKNTALYAQYNEIVYVVTFLDFDDSVLLTDTVKDGNDAIPPTALAREGYTFTGWDKAFEAVNSNLTISAVYEINSYQIVFVDFDSTVLKYDTVDFHGSANAPEVPLRDGYIFTGWDLGFGDITSEMTITAQYKLLSYSVSIEVTQNAVAIEGASVVFNDSTYITNNEGKILLHNVLPGQYNITVTLADYVEYNTTLTISNADLTEEIELIAVGVTEFQETNCWVYPNPTSDFLMVHLSETNNKYQILLFDFSGKLLQEHRLTGTQKRVDLKNYASGTYMLKITDDYNQTIQTFKIIKH